MILDKHRVSTCWQGRSKTAKTVAEAIVELWINVFSVPEKIHTDRGACFTATLFQELMKLLGIMHTVTPPYSTEGDWVERTLGHSILCEIWRPFPGKRLAEKIGGSYSGVKLFDTWHHQMFTILHDVWAKSPFTSTGKITSTAVDVIFPWLRRNHKICQNLCRNWKTD